MFKPNPKQGKKPKKSTVIPKKIVAEVFDRDSETCQYCGVLTAGLDENSCLIQGHVHHIVKRRRAEGHHAELLNTACWKCHSGNNHGKISLVDREWVKGKDVYFSGRITNKSKDMRNRISSY